MLLFLGAVAGVAEAIQPIPPSQLTVRVLQPNGNPVSLATACMAQGSQAWSRLTTGGVAVLTGLPAGAYTLHVIKSNFQTRSQSVNLSAGTQELTVTLQPGTSTSPAGVNCQGGGAVTALPPITITSFTVDNLPADRKVTSPPVTHLPLRATFDRQPAFYRIVEDSGYAYTTPLQHLQTIPWLSTSLMVPNAPFTYLFPLNLARPYGTRVVYLQVSHVASEDGASQIKSVSVILTPGPFRTSVLTVTDLRGFLDRAQQQGYGPLKPKTYKVIPRGSSGPPFPPLNNLNAYCPLPLGGTPVLVNSPGLLPGATTLAAGFMGVPIFGPIIGLVILATQPKPDPIKTVIETAEFHAFAGPPLMPFWKITDLVMFHDWLLPPASSDWFLAPPASTISVSGYTMVNNPFQPPLQAPERIIRIERTTQFGSDKYVACSTSPAGALSAPPLPVFRSVTVVGPDGRDPREAFPPR